MYKPSATSKPKRVKPWSERLKENAQQYSTPMMDCMRIRGELGDDPENCEETPEAEQERIDGDQYGAPITFE